MPAEQQVLPDLASLTPGRELAGQLDELVLSEVPDERVTEVLRATWRQISHLHARYWATMVELSRREPARTGSGRQAQAWELQESWHWATHQIAAALTFTGRRADTEYGLARQLCDDLPLVWQALSDGQIDPPKAKVFAGYLINLTAPQIEVISRRVLPHAPRWTTGQLAHRLLREVLAIDPTYTRRRYEKAVRERGVSGYLTEDGTAVLSGHGLNPTEAAAAAERLEQLAAAVRAAGHPHTEAQLRADLFVRLLDGRYAGLSSDEIITALLAEAGTRDVGSPNRSEADRGSDRQCGGIPEPGTAPEPGGAPERGGAPEPATAEPATAPRPGTTPEPGTAPEPGGLLAPDTSPDLGTSRAAVATGPTLNPATAATHASNASADRTAAGFAGDETSPAAPWTPNHAADTAATEATATDPTTTDPTTTDPTTTDPTTTDPRETEPITRDAAATDVTDADRATGVEAGDGTAPRRNRGAPAGRSAASAPDGGPPTTPPLPSRGLRTGIEVRVGLATLLGFDDHPAELPGWGPITAQDARLLVDRQAGAEWRFAVVDTEGYLILGGLIRRRPTGRSDRAVSSGGAVEIHIRADLLSELVSHPGLPPDWTAVVAEIARRFADRDAELARLDADPAARFPGAGLRRHVQMRDRTCVAPGCRRPARKADIDHTRDHARGGATVRANVEPLCLRHHMMKHRGGWTLTQPKLGHFCWRSPLGQLYRTRGEPIAPDLPAPVPGPAPADHSDASGVQWEIGPIFHPGEWARLRPPQPPAEPDEPDDRAPPF